MRKMTAAVGLPTLRLIRTKIEKYHLDQLDPGQWVFIEKKDII